MKAIKIRIKMINIFKKEKIFKATKLDVNETLLILEILFQQNLI